MKNKLRLINMNNVEIEEIKWVWHPYIPYGKLTIVQGDPGEGKTTFVLSLIALLTTGQHLPESGTAIEPINVIYQTAEDGLADTIKPRLVAAGADCAKVLVIDESEKELTMCDERLEQAILQTGAKLVVLDPLQAYLGGSVDMHRANEVRPIFKKLAALAENTGCAIILIGHMNKTQGVKSSYRGLGSIDFRAAARSVLVVGRLKEEPTVRIVAHDKSSLAPEGKAIAFTVQKHLIAVSAVLSDAKRNEIIPKNPAHMIELPPIEKTVQTIPTDAQIKELMNVLLDEPEHYRYYYFLAIYTGCRRGELCGLKWSDFQIINNIQTLVVSRSRSALPYSGVVVKGTKNNKERSILLSQDIFDMVQGYWYIKKMQAERLGIEMSEYLFTDDKGGMIHPDTFSKRLRKIYDEIGFSKDFHLHTLRHYFVTAMLHSGVDKQTVADLAGHGDTSFLERTYCHPQTLAKQKAAVGMANILFDSTGYIDADGKEQPIKIA